PLALLSTIIKAKTIVPDREHDRLGTVLAGILVCTNKVSCLHDLLVLVPRLFVRRVLAFLIGEIRKGARDDVSRSRARILREIVHDVLLKRLTFGTFVLPVHHGFRAMVGA